jgi:hypothetical protein
VDEGDDVEPPAGGIVDIAQGRLVVADEHQFELRGVFEEVLAHPFLEFLVDMPHSKSAISNEPKADITLEFVGSSKDDLSDFPLEAREKLGSPFGRLRKTRKLTMPNLLKALAEPVFCRSRPTLMGIRTEPSTLCS